MCARILAYKDVSVGSNARDLFSEHINNLSSTTCKQLVLKTMCSIDDMFDVSLRPKVDHGVTRAVSTANATVNKWGAKVCFVIISVMQFI